MVRQTKTNNHFTDLTLESFSFGGSSNIDTLQTQTSWTPILSFDGDSSNINYVVQEGLYSVVGKICKYTFRIEIESFSSNPAPATASVRISLPVPVETMVPQAFSLGFENIDLTGFVQPLLFNESGVSNYCLIKKTQKTIAPENLQKQDLLSVPIFESGGTLIL